MCDRNVSEECRRRQHVRAVLVGWWCGVYGAWGVTWAGGELDRAVQCCRWCVVTTGSGVGVIPPCEPCVMQRWLVGWADSSSYAYGWSWRKGQQWHTLVCCQVRLNHGVKLMCHVGDTLVACDRRVRCGVATRIWGLAHELRIEWHGPALRDLLPYSCRVQLGASPHDAAHEDMEICRVP